MQSRFGKLEENKYVNDKTQQVDLLEETNESLILLAQATKSDKDTITQLVKTNAELASQVKTLMSKVTELAGAVSKLSGCKPSVTQTNIEVGYCWSHRMTRNGQKHNSKNCGKKKVGHQDEATVESRMGGLD